MKKKLAFKFASILSVMLMSTAVVYKIPDSFVLWGEPTPPLEKPEN
ncbi:hypothetical protein ABFP60_12045 [Clostridioides difficile]